jgi:hypothetical protein
MSELAFLNMIALARNFKKNLLNQSEAKWEQWGQPILERKTIVIVGLGLLAEHLAERDCLGRRRRIAGKYRPVAAQACGEQESERAFAFVERQPARRRGVGAPALPQSPRCRRRALGRLEDDVFGLGHAGSDQHRGDDF